MTRENERQALDTFSYEILSLLKSGYLATVEKDDFEVHDIGSSFSARQFYVARLEDNLIRSMDVRHIEEYRRGSGSELDDKMRALRSSSAMTFNLLGNGPVNVLWSDSRESYEVSYEVQLPTRASGLPANLDAMLVNKDHVIACEMKMLEWLLGKPGVLKSAYRKRETYRDERTANAFLNLADTLFDQNGLPLLARYDAAQMFKHALALYNSCTEGRWPTQRRVDLVNVVHEMGESALRQLSPLSRNHYEDALAEEHRGAQHFVEAASETLAPLFETLGFAFTTVYAPVSDLISMLELDDATRSTLRTRYLLE